MFAKQISVFLENKSGRLLEVTSILAKENIDIMALCIADTTDFGILRMVVDRPDDALVVLHDNGFTVNTTEVITVPMDNEPGGLAKILSALDGESGCSIEYMYAFVGNSGSKATAVLRVENSEKAIELLKIQNIQ